VLITALVGAALLHASADRPPSCASPPGVETRSFSTDLPVGLSKALAERLGDVAQPGARFDSTDVVMTGRNRRVIFVWMRGPRWVVATEHGGRVYNDPIFAFDVTANGAEARLVEQKIAFPESVCATALSLLDNR
jgi:hypothetical protein